MKPITYSKATINDLQMLIDSRMEFSIEYGGAQTPEQIKELKQCLKGYFIQHISNNSYISILARADNNVVVGVGGMVIRLQPGNFKNPSGRVAYIMNMFTIPSYRRKGICSNILKKLIEEGKEMGLILFELHATKEGEQVYPGHGFLMHDEPIYRRYIETK